MTENPLSSSNEAAPENVVFIFLHGFGSMPTDLYPLATAFTERGYLCELPTFDGHGGSTKDLKDATYESWFNQVDALYQQHKSANRRVYLIGFSLGALLAIDFSKTRSLDGIICISTFLSPRYQKLAERYLSLLRFLRIRSLRRFPNTTLEVSRRSLAYNTRLPVASALMLIRKAQQLAETGRMGNCPILLIHSIHDKVCDYQAMVRFYNLLPTEKRIVTLRNLNHFLQFDMPPFRIRDVVLEFLELATPRIDSGIAGTSSIEKIYEQAQIEHRHWADILFKLIFGFFTIFGALLLHTLTDVTTKTSKAPYYLMSYSSAINIYILLGSLYFFYLNRTIIHVKHHVDPLFSAIPPFSYRTLAYASGLVSQKMTRFAATVIFGVPILISIGVLVYAILEYADRFMVLEARNAFLQCWLAGSAITMVLSVMSLWSVAAYTRMELHVVPRPVKTTPSFEGALLQLYVSIQPGCVQQDPGVVLSDLAQRGTAPRARGA